MPLVCSNCSTHCSPESPPLVGFKVVPCNRPSLMKRLTEVTQTIDVHVVYWLNGWFLVQVYLLQSAVDYTQ